MNNVHMSLFSLEQVVYHKSDRDGDPGIIYKVEFNLGQGVMYGVVCDKDKQNVHFEHELSETPVYKNPTKTNCIFLNNPTNNTTNNMKLLKSLILMIAIIAISSFSLVSCEGVPKPAGPPTLAPTTSTAYSADATVKGRTFKIYFDEGSLSYFTAVSIISPEYITNIQEYKPGVLLLPSGETLVTSTAEVNAK